MRQDLLFSTHYTVGTITDVSGHSFVDTCFGEKKITKYECMRGSTNEFFFESKVSINECLETSVIVQMV